MKNIVAIAKKIVREVDNDFESPSIQWQVWSLDVWGNEKDGWEVNDRRKAFTFECNEQEEFAVIKAFEKELVKHYKVKTKLEYEWFDENNFFVNEKKTGKYLFQVEKIQ